MTAELNHQKARSIASQKNEKSSWDVKKKLPIVEKKKFLLYWNAYHISES